MSTSFEIDAGNFDSTKSSVCAIPTNKLSLIVAPTPSLNYMVWTVGKKGISIVPKKVCKNEKWTWHDSIIPSAFQNRRLVFYPSEWQPVLADLSKLQRVLGIRLVVERAHLLRVSQGKGSARHNHTLVNDLLIKKVEGGEIKGRRGELLPLGDIGSNTLNFSWSPCPSLLIWFGQWQTGRCWVSQFDPCLLLLRNILV